MNEIHTDRSLEFVRHQLAGMQYGTLVITVHNGEVTQVDKTEKVRFQEERSARNYEK